MYTSLDSVGKMFIFEVYKSKEMKHITEVQIYIKVLTYTQTNKNSVKTTSLHKNTDLS
jgi:hypothetical protein